LRQTDFDAFLKEFRQMVSLAKIILENESTDGASSSEGNAGSYYSSNGGSGKGAGSFALDFQVIVPLYVVARKCRDPVIRRQAIALLLGKKRRESVWDV
jgi:hypothetical protein